jgi:hypothetical protein
MPVIRAARALMASEARVEGRNRSRGVGGARLDVVQTHVGPDVER